MKFHVYNSRLSLFQNYYWRVLEDLSKYLEEHAFYIAKNILQMWKSQIEAKLDQDFPCAVKQYAIEANMLDGRFDNNHKEEKDGEEELLDDGGDFEQSNAPFYTNAMEIT